MPSPPSARVEASDAAPDWGCSISVAAVEARTLKASMCMRAPRGLERRRRERRPSRAYLRASCAPRIITRIASEAITLLRNGTCSARAPAPVSPSSVTSLTSPRYQGRLLPRSTPPQLRRLLGRGENPPGLVLTGYAPGHERHGSAK